MREWLKSLTHPEDRKRIGVDIATVEFGWPIGMPVCRSLSGGVYEVRTNLEHNRIARVLFYIDRGGRMVLLTRTWNSLGVERGNMKGDFDEAQEKREGFQSQRV